MPNRRLRRNRAAIHPERTLDFLVPEMPEVSLRLPALGIHVAPNPKNARVASDPNYSIAASAQANSDLQQDEP